MIYFKPTIQNFTRLTGRAGRVDYAEAFGMKDAKYCTIDCGSHNIFVLVFDKSLPVPNEIEGRMITIHGQNRNDNKYVHYVLVSDYEIVDFKGRRLKRKPYGWIGEWPVGHGEEG